MGCGRGAAYLRVPSDGLSGCEIVAVTTADAARLPCSLQIAATSSAVPLSALAGLGAPVRCVVGGGEIAWRAATGDVSVVAVRDWAVTRVGRGVLDLDAYARAGRLAAHIGVPPDGVRGLVEADSTLRLRAAVAELIGLGPGLTPSGDDLLCGYLLGSRAFGAADAEAAAGTVLDAATGRTTALAVELLRHSARGECIPEVAAFVRALQSPRHGRTELPQAWHRVGRIGNTTGSAMAAGVLAAAERVARQAR
jgi:hypothetical protein